MPSCSTVRIRYVKRFLLTTLDNFKDQHSLIYDKDENEAGAFF